jgi:hypothetical protein
VGNDEYARVLGQVLDGTTPGPVLRPVRLPTAAAEVADRLITAIAIGRGIAFPPSGSWPRSFT